MIDALSPLDGRYAKTVEPVRAWFSEVALTKYRCEVEVAHVLALDAMEIFPKLTEQERARCAAAITQFDYASYAQIKELEATLRHDVKACEVYLRNSLELANPNRIHFGLTSEDVNNLAYARMLHGYREQVQLPALRSLGRDLMAMAKRTASVAFPARTHGQHATPTTFGKELAVVLARLIKAYAGLRDLPLTGKLNGATGTYAASLAAAPHIDFRAYEARLLGSLGLTPSLATTQIEDPGAFTGYFDAVRTANRILEGFCQDVWMYVSYAYLKQSVVAGEVGSSTMPHKINPIHFENAEGNFQLSSALFDFLGNKLARSRMQRDLSGSTVLRNLGVACGHHHLAVAELARGLARVEVDSAFCKAELAAHPELLTEPIQTMLRLLGSDDVYTQLKALSRGSALTLVELHAFVHTLNIPEDVRARMLALTPESYIGDASRVCHEVLARAEEIFG